MARDNSPKERQRQQLQRKLGGRPSYDRVLIVSEGQKTEPNYFREIRRVYRLHTAHVEVHPSELGTAPIQVVQHAKELFEKGDRYRDIPPRAFERVCAVFDRDDHLSYHDALRQSERLNGRLRNDAKQPVVFQAVPSVPNFELWFLLHYEDIQAPLERHEVIRRLRRHIQDYDKGSTDAFAATRENLPIAIERARRLAARFTPDDDPEPYTGVSELVDLLINLGSP